MSLQQAIQSWKLFSSNFDLFPIHLLFVTPKIAGFIEYSTCHWRFIRLLFIPKLTVITFIRAHWKFMASYLSDHKMIWNVSNPVNKRALTKEACICASTLAKYSVQPPSGLILYKQTILLHCLFPPLALSLPHWPEGCTCSWLLHIEPRVQGIHGPYF